MSVQKDIEALARDVAKEAKKADNLVSKIDALKILVPLYVVLAKRKKDDGEPDELSMSDIQSRLRLVEETDGSAETRAIPDRGRRGA